MRRSAEEALEVVTKNPGILSCDPAGLRESNKGTVKAMASAVDVVESLLWWK